MLFWHLLRHKNAHIRFSMLRFSFGRSFKIAIVIRFFVFLEVCSFGICSVTKMLTYVLNENLSSVAGGGGALKCATPPKIQAKA